MPLDGGSVVGDLDSSRPCRVYTASQEIMGRQLFSTFAPIIIASRALSTRIQFPLTFWRVVREGQQTCASDRVSGFAGRQISINMVIYSGNPNYPSLQHFIQGDVRRAENPVPILKVEFSTKCGICKPKKEKCSTFCRQPMEEEHLK